MTLALATLKLVSLLRLLGPLLATVLQVGRGVTRHVTRCDVVCDEV